MNLPASLYLGGLLKSVRVAEDVGQHQAERPIAHNVVK
jgi:hypothetical protein